VSSSIWDTYVIASFFLELDGVKLEELPPIQLP
jgi:hypothetical protein